MWLSTSLHHDCRAHPNCIPAEWVCSAGVTDPFLASAIRQRVDKARLRLNEKCSPAEFAGFALVTHATLWNVRLVLSLLAIPFIIDCKNSGTI